MHLNHVLISYRIGKMYFVPKATLSLSVVWEPILVFSPITSYVGLSVGLSVTNTLAFYSKYNFWSKKFCWTGLSVDIYKTIYELLTIIFCRSALLQWTTRLCNIISFVKAPSSTNVLKFILKSLLYSTLICLESGGLYWRLDTQHTDILCSDTQHQNTQHYIHEYSITTYNIMYKS